MFVIQCRKNIQNSDKAAKKTEYKYTYDMLCVMMLTQNQKLDELKIVVWPCYPKSLLCGIHFFTISICNSMPQFNDGA